MIAKKLQLGRRFGRQRTADATLAGLRRTAELQEVVGFFGFETVGFIQTHLYAISSGKL